MSEPLSSPPSNAGPLTAESVTALMRELLHTVRQEIHTSQQQQQQQLQVLQQALQAALPAPIPIPAPSVLAPAAAAAAPLPIRPRIALPSLFDGDASKLDGWVRELQQQFAYYSTPEGERLRMGAAYLRSVALDWWASLSASEQPSSWDSFVSSLRSRFQPLSTATLARRQLDGLRQGTGQSVNEYISSFRRLLVPLPEMHENDRLHVFIRGLRPQIAQQVILQRADTLAKAIEIASFVGGVGISMNTPAPGGASAPSGGMDLSALGLAAIDGDGTTAIGAPSSAVSEVMQLRQELNALRSALQQARGSQNPPGNRGAGAGSRLPRIPHLQPEQVKKYMDANMCFGCKSTQHRWHACPTRQQGN
jgi:hypothetical protein